MPIKPCTQDGKEGFKWGNSGKCYTGKDGHEKAVKQMKAIYKSGYKESSMLKEVLEAKEEKVIKEDPVIKDLNKFIDKLIKDKDQKALDILSKELGKIQKNLK